MGEGDGTGGEDEGVLAERIELEEKPLVHRSDQSSSSREMMGRECTFRLAKAA
jgi:hypothetical protein